MLYKRFITLAVFVLLILAVLIALWLWRAPGVQAPTIDLTGRIHTSLYQGASDVWSAQLTTAPFENSPSTMIHLEWQKPTQTYNHFLITATDAQTGWTRTESGEHERVTLDVPDLFPDTLYTFVIQACLDRDCSAWLIADAETTARTQVIE